MPEKKLVGSQVHDRYYITYYCISHTHTKKKYYPQISVDDSVTGASIILPTHTAVPIT